MQFKSVDPVFLWILNRELFGRAVSQSAGIYLTSPLDTQI